MANTNKTKAEILQELESIKGLLLEEDNIPILQDSEIIDEEPIGQAVSETKRPVSPYTTHGSVLPGQGSLFGEVPHAITNTYSNIHKQDQQTTTHNSTPEPEHKKHGFASHLNNPAHQQTPRPQVKATGENPFLPQHIRERLHGNNPPPLFEYEAAKKIINATKTIAPQTGKQRQQLVDELIKSVMPQVEHELRHRLFAMSVEDLEKLLNEADD